MVSHSEVSFHLLTNDRVHNVSHCLQELMSCVKYHYLNNESITNDPINNQYDILLMTVID